VSRPLPFPPSDSPVSPISPFNPFEDYHNNRPAFLPGNYPSIPTSPVRPASPSPPIPPPPPPRQTQTRHEWIHNVDEEPTIGYLSDLVFIRLLSPNGPFVSFLSWHLCEHQSFSHTQVFLTTVNVRNAASTSSFVDELSFYVTAGVCRVLGWLEGD
jgi:hypothetical protein